MKPIAGPDPHPKKPRFVPPPGACDAHCHVFGPDAKFPFAAKRPYTPPDAPKEMLMALHKFLGLERCVIVHPSVHGTDNRATLDAIKASGGRYRGVGLVDDAFTEADLRALHEGGIRGCRFNFTAALGGPPNLDVIRRVLQRIEPLGWHVVLHIDASEFGNYADFLRGIRIPFVIDHMGRVKAGDGVQQPAFQALLELMKRDNCWVKVSGADRITTAGAPFYDAIPYCQAVIAAAPDRVLWGTDFPHPNAVPMPNDGDLVDLIPLIAPDAATRRKLLVDNPTRLYFAS
jgi:2-pyrone-4,6-dicarboxylate lactonase